MLNRISFFVRKHTFVIPTEYKGASTRNCDFFRQKALAFVAKQSPGFTPLGHRLQPIVAVIRIRGLQVPPFPQFRQPQTGPFHDHRGKESGRHHGNPGSGYIEHGLRGFQHQNLRVCHFVQFHSHHGLPIDFQPFSRPLFGPEIFPFQGRHCIFANVRPFGTRDWKGFG